MEALREIGGDLAPADARLIGANNIRVNESALTGESGFRATKSPRRVVPDPGLRKAVVRVQPAEPGPPGWLLILGMSLIPFLWGQGLRAMQAMKNRDHERTGCP
ncbi:MAG: hypothetical protein ACLFUE_11145 [Desulfobacteraceae bacterium]